MEKNIPHHINTIISELEESNNYEEVLLSYTYLLSKDVTLMQIYLKLGYCLKSNGFTKPLVFSQIRSILLQEYTMQQQNVEHYFAEPHSGLDYEAEIRHELLKFFYDQGINEIASSVDIGLEIPEDTSLASLWEDFFPQNELHNFRLQFQKKLKNAQALKRLIT